MAGKTTTKSAYATPTEQGRAKAAELEQRYQESDLGLLPLTWSIVYSTGSMVMDADVTVEIQDEFARLRYAPGCFLNWWSNAGTTEQERFFFLVTRALSGNYALNLVRHLTNHEIDEAWKAVGSAQKAHREDLGKLQALQRDYVKLADDHTKLVLARDEAESAATDLGKRLDEACAYAHDLDEKLERTEQARKRLESAYRSAQAKLLEQELQALQWAE